MTPRSIEEYRAPGSTASLEDDWIAAVEADPENLDSFLDLAQALVASDEEDRARGLLELYDAELKSRSLFPTRLELLRRAGLLVLKPNKLQREILATLEGIWSTKPNFKSILEYVGLHKPSDEPKKIWDKVTRLQSLLLYDVGEVVAMANQGVGRVVEVNLPLETLKIDFERLSGVTVGFRAAAKMLTPLPPGHLLRRKLEDPEGLAKLRDEQPAELLRAVLEAAGRPLLGSEIRDTLAGHRLRGAVDLVVELGAPASADHGQHRRTAALSLGELDRRSARLGEEVVRKGDAAGEARPLPAQRRARPGARQIHGREYSVAWPASGWRASRPSPSRPGSPSSVPATCPPTCPGRSRICSARPPTRASCSPVSTTACCASAP